MSVTKALLTVNVFAMSARTPESVVNCVLVIESGRISVTVTELIFAKLLCKPSRLAAMFVLLSLIAYFVIAARLDNKLATLPAVKSISVISVPPAPSVETPKV